MTTIHYVIHVRLCYLSLSNGFELLLFFVMIFFGLSLAVTAQIQTMTNGSARNPQEIKINEHRMQYNTTFVHAQLQQSMLCCAFVNVPEVGPISTHKFAMKHVSVAILLPQVQSPPLKKIL